MSQNARSLLSSCCPFPAEVAQYIPCKPPAALQKRAERRLLHCLFHCPGRGEKVIWLPEFRGVSSKEWRLTTPIQAGKKKRWQELSLAMVPGFLLQFQVYKSPEGTYKFLSASFALCDWCKGRSP